MNTLERIWWVVLFIFVSIGVTVILGAAFSIDDPLVIFFDWIMLAFFLPFWAAVGLEIYREFSGYNDEEHPL